MALPDNYGLQMTEDRKSQISRITTKDPTAPDTAYHARHSAQIRQHVEHGGLNPGSFTDKRGKVLPDSRTSQLVVVATDNSRMRGLAYQPLDTPPGRF